MYTKEGTIVTKRPLSSQ